MISAEEQVAVGTRRRWRLVPDMEHLGWTPYVWLVYLGLYLFEPILQLRAGSLPASAATAIGLGLLAFLVSYFRGFWATGNELLGIVAVQCALGVVLAPVTWGASVFFVYAASFAGNIELGRLAARMILATASVCGTTFWIMQAPLRYTLPGLGMPLIIGFVNLHYAEVRRANARLRLAHEQIHLLAAVAERERIARDLHDVLGHTLSLIVLKSELVAKLLSRDPARAEQEIRDVELVARNALRDVRETIRGYRASLAEEMERSRTLLHVANIQAESLVDTAKLATILSPSQGEVLALALREAVTNVVRHAQASTCRLELTMDARDIVLRVGDDGIGRTAPEGAGLRGMRERAEALGGAMHSGPISTQSGWRVEVRLPATAT
jgi:two-component system, NarL family, sensor histidine kinase DesK